MTLPRIAVLDDYEGLARSLADWSVLDGLCQIDVIDRKLAIPDEAARVLQPYAVLCHLRERTAMPAALIEQLPQLRFMTVTGRAHRTLDLAAATRCGVAVSHVSKDQAASEATPELAWGLILAAARRIVSADASIRRGGWDTTPGILLEGKTLGLLGLGRIGQSSSLHALCIVNGVHCKALMDTGSTVSIVQHGILHPKSWWMAIRVDAYQSPSLYRH